MPEMRQSPSVGTANRLVLMKPNAGCHKRPGSGYSGPVVNIVSRQKHNRLEQYFKTSTSLSGMLFRGQQSTFGKLT